MKKIALLLAIMVLNAECFAQLLEPLCIESLTAGPTQPIGGFNSSLTVTWKGGTAPFTVVFSAAGLQIPPVPNAVSPVTFANAPADSYTVTVTDSSTPQQTVSGQAAIGQSGTSLSLSIAETDATCTESNGSVTAFAKSNDPADTFTFILTSTTPGFPLQTNPSGIFPNLPAGTYTVLADTSGSAGIGRITVCNNGITHTGNSIMDFIITKKCNGCIAP